MRPDAPALVEKIVTALRRGPAPRSSADLACEFLGTGLLDEHAARLVLDPVLDRDARLVRGQDGWSVRASASRYAAADPPLAAPHLCAFAPRHPAVAAALRAAVPGDPAGGGDPREPAAAAGAQSVPLAMRHDARYAVSVGGRAELERAVLRGAAGGVPGPVVDLGALARRWRGFSGPRDVRAIAAHAGCRVVDADTPGSMAEMLAACWASYVDALALEEVTHVSDVERLLEERLEAADFAGKTFGPAQLDALPAAPGVYEFRDADGRVLYVGQSACLAARVRSYFTGPPRDDKDRALRRDATSLAIRRAPSAPDALIDEMRRIERLRPALNAKRPVREEGAEDGLVLAPRFGDGDDAPAGWIWFALRDGRLAGRGTLLPGPKRAPSAAHAAVHALCAGPARDEEPASLFESRREAVLVDAWRRSSRFAPWLRLAIDGGEDALEATLVAIVRHEARGAG